MAHSTKKTSKWKLDKMIEYYQSGLSAKISACNVNSSAKVCLNELRRRGIQIRGCSDHKSQTGKNSVRFKGYEDMHSWYLSNAQRRSKKLGIEFNLNAKFLWELFIKQNKKCALSGDPIFFSKKRSSRSEGTASLDRIDSTKGYTMDNVQWVHKNVNLMKMYLDETTFISFCEKIYLKKREQIHLIGQKKI